MAAGLITIRGRVRPGATMRPPYADARCVIWGAKHSDQPHPAGGTLPFVLDSEGGEEFLVDGVGASAIIRVRTELDLPEFIHGKTSSLIPATRVVTRYGVGWIEPGDKIVVRGRPTAGSSGPFRGGPRPFQAKQIRQSAPRLGAVRITALGEGEPEDPDSGFDGAREPGDKAP